MTIQESRLFFWPAEIWTCARSIFFSWMVNFDALNRSATLIPIYICWDSGFFGSAWCEEHKSEPVDKYVSGLAYISQCFTQISLACFHNPILSLHLLGPRSVLSSFIKSCWYETNICISSGAGLVMPKKQDHPVHQVYIHVDSLYSSHSNKPWLYEVKSRWARYVMSHLALVLSSYLLMEPQVYKLIF